MILGVKLLGEVGPLQVHLSDLDESGTTQRIIPNALHINHISNSYFTIESTT